MKLPIGARLPHDFADIPANEPEIVQRNRAIYRITHILHETPWSCLYRGKKIFRNFEFTKSALTEATDDECLDVLIRTLAYPRTDDREYIKARREHAGFELKQVLGLRRTNSIAEPLDYLEIRNDQDQFAFPRPGKIPKSEPILVFETIDGQELERWRQSEAFDVPLGLHVLGQILEFLSSLHAVKFLLNVVTPSAFWVDDLHQIHCLGTENIVDERRAATWRGLFPNDRYAQGFVAPELLQADTPPSIQSDLYGWATLAWLILIGEHPARLATTQHQRVARFESTHREQLRRELITLTLPQVAAVKRELGVTGSRFELQWPDSFIEGLWSCLDPDAALRPTTVAELRAWWGTPPPQPVPAFLAVRQAGGTVRFVFSTEGLRPGLQFEITREGGQPPQAKGSSQVIWRGTANERIEVRIPLPPGGPPGSIPTADWRFQIVSTELISGTTAVSRPTLATCVDGTVQGYRRLLAESYAARSKALPAEVTLLAQLDPIDAVTDDLFDSQFDHVRRWALEILERHLSSLPLRPASRTFLRDRAILDAENEVRQQAAGLLLRHSAVNDVAMVVDLAQRMGGNAVDDMIRAARGFFGYGVEAETIESAIERLEQQHRIVVCPVCQHDLRTRELDQHLISIHRYVPLDGKLLPFGQALTRLWSRVIQNFDPTALQELTGHLQQRQSQQVVAAFATALSQQVIFVLQSQGAHHTPVQRQRWFAELGQCLHSNQIARSACWTLLSYEDARIRELARGAVMLSAVSRLVGDSITASVFRDTINALAPLPIVNERIETCRQLIALGASQFAGEQCEKELELERLVDCPECGTTFPKRGLASHRRQRHQVFEWEGARYTWDSLVPLLLDRTVAVEADAFAARNLAELFIERHGTAAWQPLYQSLRQQLFQSLTADNLTALTSGFATAFGGLSLAPRLSREFLNETNGTCQTAGLAIFANLHSDAPSELMRLVAGRLGQPGIPVVVCQQVAIRLLKTSGIDQEITRRALLALASRADDGLKGIELLRTLEQWVGPTAAIDVACAELAAKIRMRCPRCDALMTPPELARHVRAEHGMILEGRSVRQPWSVVMECLDEYAESPKAELLERAEELVDFMSPRKGRLRLWRESLRRGIAPPHYRQLMLDSISRTNDSLCPECWETLSAGDTVESELQIDGRGNIQSNFVSLVQLGVHGIWGSVEIAPRTGPVPPWSLTRLAASLAVGIVFLIPAVLFGLFSLQGNSAARIPAILTGVCGLIGGLSMAWFYRPRSSIPLDVAWEYVVPALLETEGQPLGPIPSAFIANLCRVSVDRGNPQLRRQTLKRAIQTIRPGVKRGSLPMSHLIELWMLRFEDALHSRRWPNEAESVLKDMLAQMVTGDLSLQLDARARTLLSRLRLDELARGFWNLILHARASGLNAVDLMELCRHSSTLGTLLARISIRVPDLPQYIALLELEQTGRIPLGIISVRQLISQGKASLAEHPNLLARSELAGRSVDHDAILLSPGELHFRTRQFNTCPDVVVREKRQFVQTGWTHQRQDGGPDLRYAHNNPTGYDEITGYTLSVGTQTWNYKVDPAPLAAKLRKAGSFLFGDLPLLAEKLQREPVSPFLPRLLGGLPVRCPRCQASLRYRKGGLSEKTTDPASVLEVEEVV